MTPEERNLIIDLFDRLSTLEDAQRDPDAERLIRDGLRQAPNAPYALVQTVLVQDEALKRADARIRALEGASGAAARSELSRRHAGQSPRPAREPQLGALGAAGRGRHVAGLAVRHPGADRHADGRRAGTVPGRRPRPRRWRRAARFWAPRRLPRPA